MSLTRAYNDAVHSYRVKHARTFSWMPGAVEADLSAIDKAAALFVAGCKALSEALDGTDMLNGDVDSSDCFERLEGFVEGMPNHSVSCAYVDAICRLIAAEPRGPVGSTAQSQLAA
jgi:hypothetical protein